MSTPHIDFARSIASNVYRKYRNRYGDELQGCCLLIADEILREAGGDVVAGYLTWYGGSCRRSHWWVEYDGEILDPFGDEFLSYEEATGREEVHRDKGMFRKLLPQYEQYRVAWELEK